MIVLSIETAGHIAGASLAEDTGIPVGTPIERGIRIIGEFCVQTRMNHSVKLMPMVEALFNSTGKTMEDVDFVACSEGPGSFTGLRIGAATAKSLAFAADLKIVPVSTLDALAYNIFDNHAIIAPILDARRSQVYTAFYEWRTVNKAYGLVRLSDYRAEDIHETINALVKYTRPIIFLGDGVAEYQRVIIESGINASFAPGHLLLQKSSSVAAMGIKLARQGKTVHSHEFSPFYLRKPQAEREREL
ncbi:MAG: tRNA (adenosine(37)-N6)-threonylcarbamoyltransferase complex dimerization subunit type 1 TsaB [Clostridiales bacterium]|jgi:tRNA threonylcarbamoyladenosine biosynthesis protein TsaB|nr:tRNA (adenosine(37)-N6)-threonylcarbamoyltransferase complex dimerization subunit type 1 TsaB [Clostridiales bacterium]